MKRMTFALAALALIAPPGAPSLAQKQPLTDADRVIDHPSPKVRVVEGIVFARYGARELRLDLYLPAVHKHSIPGVIAIHGGGWMESDRKRCDSIASALAERGVAAASIEYRTADEAAFPGAIQDVKAAIRWMRAHAPDYGIDPDAIGTLGGSSGAHMALLAGLADDRDFEGAGGNKKTSSRVQAVVAMATPTDLARLDAVGRQTVAIFLHATLKQNPKLWAHASPVNHLNQSGPPVLLLHGAADVYVLPEQSKRFATLYKSAGGSVELVVLPGAPHPFWNYRPWYEDVMNRAAAFFLHLNAPSTVHQPEVTAP